MKYSIVIPTYNNCDKCLKPCLEALFKYSHLSDIELIISANGCTDNTLEYLGNLKDDFEYLGYGNHLKIVWNKEALGYPRATNLGIIQSTCDKVVLLNNDAMLLPQHRGDWLRLLHQGFENNVKCGVSCSLKKHSDITKMDFGVFFCVMIDKKLFDEVGLLDEQYALGGNEDIDFCAAIQMLGYTVEQPVPIKWEPSANLHVGTFPLYHKGEATVHDTTLVQGWEKNFRLNELKLAKKYNMEYFLAHKDEFESLR